MPFNLDPFIFLIIVAVFFAVSLVIIFFVLGRKRKETKMFNANLSQAVIERNKDLVVSFQGTKTRNHTNHNVRSFSGSSSNSNTTSSSGTTDVLTGMLLMDAMSGVEDKSDTYVRQPSEPAPSPVNVDKSENWSGVSDKKSPVESWSGIPDEPVSQRSSWSSVDDSTSEISRSQASDRGWSSISSNDSPSWSSPAPSPSPSSCSSSCSSSSSGCSGGD